MRKVVRGRDLSLSCQINKKIVKKSKDEDSLNWMDTLRTLIDKLENCKEDNERIVRSQYRKA